jgi:hypothetical protein
MRYLLMLAAAASLAACHNRSDEETGAAPVRDTTAVAADTTKGMPTDSTMGQRPSETDTSAVRSDSTTTTTGVDSTGPSTTGNAPTDTSTTQQTTSDSSKAGWSDSTSMGNDSTKMSMPADSTNR